MVAYAPEVTPSRFAPTQGDQGDMTATGHPDRENIIQFLFSLGIDRSLPPHQIPEGACREIKNMYYPREIRTPRTRPGMQLFETGTSIAVGKVTNMTVFQKSDGTSVIVFATLNSDGDDQELYYLDATYEQVQITSSLGSTSPPSFLTFGGRLLIAVPGQYIREWDGEMGTDPAAAQATGSITVGSEPADGETLTVGDITWTFKPTRVQPLEIALGGSNAATATNIISALTTDTWEVEASSGGSGVVSLTSRRYGTGGNSINLSDTTGGNLTLSGAALTGGVNGLALNVIDSYVCPMPAILSSDKNGRVVAAGDTRSGYENRLYFSAPGEAMSWAYGDYGSGEYQDIGQNEGNTFSAVVPFLDELVIHKNGQNKEIYRVFLQDPDPASWLLRSRFFAGHVAALNHRCAVSVADKHLVMDNKMFRVFTGNDTYDEIASTLDGNKIYDVINNSAQSTAFIVVNPEELYALVFSREGRECAVFHYGTKRWTRWYFGERSISCGIYHEGLGILLLGADDGKIYQLDPLSELDGTTYIGSEIIGRSIGSDILSKILVKHTLVDTQNHIGGTGTVDAIVNREEANPKRLFSFTVVDQDILIFEATDPIYEAEYSFTNAESYGRFGSFQQCDGESIAPRVALANGAFSLNNLIMRVAYIGRAGK